MRLGSSRRDLLGHSSHWGASVLLLSHAEIPVGKHLQKWQLARQFLGRVQGSGAAALPLSFFGGHLCAWTALVLPVCPVKTAASPAAVDYSHCCPTLICVGFVGGKCLGHQRPSNQLQELESVCQCRMCACSLELAARHHKSLEARSWAQGHFSHWRMRVGQTLFTRCRALRPHQRCRSMTVRWPACLHQQGSSVLCSLDAALSCCPQWP